MRVLAKWRPSWSVASATWTSPWVSTPTVTLIGSDCAMVVMAVSLPDNGGWLLPAERADSTATSLAAQAPVRSRSLGWHCLRVAAAPSRQITAKAQVLWNALAGRLWSRTTIYVYRAL